MKYTDLKKELSELQYKSLLMLEAREFTSANKIHKQIERIKKLMRNLQEEEC